ncbi:MAG: porin [Elusimicrobiota bacterium]
MKYALRAAFAFALLWGLFQRAYATVTAVGSVVASTSSYDGKPFDGNGVQPWYDGGIPVVNTDKINLNVFGRLQMLGVGEIVPDPIRAHQRVYSFIQESRLGFRGDFEGYKFETQLALGGEDTVPAGLNPNVAFTLLDMSVDVPLASMGEDTSLKVGQFRVPYSRESLTDTGYMPFSGRSIASDAFYQGRDYGLALQSYKGKFAGTIAAMSGAGEDVPQRYLPENFGIPEIVMRVGYNDGVDEDIYHVVETDLNVKQTEKAAYFNALFTKDTQIGHSSALNLNAPSQNMMLSSQWNPYIDAGGSPAAMMMGDLFMVGGDAVIRKPLSNGNVASAEAEVNWGGYQNLYGEIHMATARVQGTYLIKRKYELALRYVAMNTGNTVGDTGFKASGDSVINEITPSATWYVKGQNFKLVAEAPVYFNMPVFNNTGPGGIGSYVMADMPNEASAGNGAGNTTTRAVVPELRIMAQFLF